MADPNWDSGNYFLSGKIPRNGLAVARMAGHISYLSEQVYKINLEENYKKVKVLIFLLMLIFRLRVI